MQKSNFSITISIPKFKNIWIHDHHAGFSRAVQFGKQSKQNQLRYFSDIIHRNKLKLEEHFGMLLITEFRMEVYPSDPTRYHLHGTFYDLTIGQMQYMHDLLCADIGIKSEKQKRDVVFINKLDSQYAWDHYILKDADGQELEEFLEQDFTGCTCYAFKGKK